MPTAGEKKNGDRERTASADLGQTSRTEGAWHKLQILTSHPVFLQAMWASSKQRTRHLTCISEAVQTNLHTAYYIIFKLSLSLLTLPVSLPPLLLLAALQSQLSRLAQDLAVPLVTDKYDCTSSNLFLLVDLVQKHGSDAVFRWSPTTDSLHTWLRDMERIFKTKTPKLEPHGKLSRLRIMAMSDIGLIVKTKNFKRSKSMKGQCRIL